MKIKAVAGSLACCIVLGVNRGSAMEANGMVGLGFIEKEENKVDERHLIEDVAVKKGKNSVSIEIAKLKADTKVQVVEEEDGWAKVKINGEIGFIRTDKLKKANQYAVVKYLEGLEYLEVYSNITEDLTKIGRIYENDKIYILEEIGPYIKVKWGEGVAYIENKKEYLVKEKYRVVNSNTVVYQTLENNDKHKKIQKGTVVTVEGETVNYYKISYENGYGYVKKDDISDIKYVGKENLHAVKLYTKDSDTSEIRTYIPSGAEVEVIKYKGEYAYCKYGEYEGYIKYNDLSLEELVLLNINEKEYISKKILDREEIERKYTEISEMYKDDKEKREEALSSLLKEYSILEISDRREIEVLKNRGRYFEVRVEGGNYFMDNKGSKVDEEDINVTHIQLEPTIQTSYKTRYISNMNINVYSDSNKKNVLGLLTRDAQVEFIEDIDATTSKIKINEGEVYVDSKFLSKTKLYRKVDQSIKNVNTNKSHKAFVEAQSKKLNVVVTLNDGNVNATAEELAYHSNPKNISVWNEEHRYQYLKLDAFRMVDAFKLNEYLNSLKGANGKNIFKDKADVFISAAKKYNIDPVYLVAHTLLETGGGTSKLARGLEYKDKGTVYNFFGIGAVDSSPIEGGKKAAYENGWTTIDKTIEGSARWLAENYIHLKKNKQNTLYKMRFNYMTRTHQYASDIKWASKISKYMSRLKDIYIDTELEFEVPIYRTGTYMKGVFANDTRKGSNSINKEVEQDKNKVEIENEGIKVEGNSNENLEDKPSEKPIEKPVDKPEIEGESGVVEGDPDNSKDEDNSNDDLQEEPPAIDKVEGESSPIGGVN